MGRRRYLAVAANFPNRYGDAKKREDEDRRASAGND